MGERLKLASCQRGAALVPAGRCPALGKNPSVNKDRLTKARRSWNRSRIRAKNTMPEKAVG